MTTSETSAPTASVCPDRMPWPGDQAPAEQRAKYWETEAKRAFFFRERARAAKPVDVDATVLALRERQLDVLEKTMRGYLRTTESYRQRAVAAEALIAKMRNALTTAEGVKRRLWELWSDVDEVQAPEIKRRMWELFTEL